MSHHIFKFVTSEEGAVTVDWVVLTALVVGLAVAAFAAIDGGSSDLALGIEDRAFLLQAHEVFLRFAAFHFSLCRR